MAISLSVWCILKASTLQFPYSTFSGLFMCLYKLDYWTLFVMPIVPSEKEQTNYWLLVKFLTFTHSLCWFSQSTWLRNPSGQSITLTCGALRHGQLLTSHGWKPVSSRQCNGCHRQGHGEFTIKLQEHLEPGSAATQDMAQRRRRVKAGTIQAVV